jgi:hypothetical protein
MIQDMTQEELEANLVRAREAKEEKKLLAIKTLRNDYADKSHWQTLAQRYGIRLPSWYTPGIEPKHVKRVFRKLNLDVALYVEAMGCGSLREMLQLNPSMPAYASVGLSLEWIDEHYPDKALINEEIPPDSDD